jgi:hypothetical protein
MSSIDLPGDGDASCLEPRGVADNPRAGTVACCAVARCPKGRNVVLDMLFATAVTKGGGQLLRPARARPGVPGRRNCLRSLPPTTDWPEVKPVCVRRPNGVAASYLQILR